MTEQPAETIERPLWSDCKLDYSHRCDRCKARAYFHVILEANQFDLYFCAHHWRQVKHVLRPKCMYVNDESRQLHTGIKDDHWVEGKPVSLPPRERL